MDDLRYFHGGPAGRQRGAMLLPPSITGSRSLSDFGAAGIHRKDRVYLATKYAAALLYAAASGRKGVVYEAEPLGAIEADPDCYQDGLSFQCERARIVRIIKPRHSELQMALRVLLDGPDVADAFAQEEMRHA